MNYIGLLNFFWSLDAERPFTPIDTRLYFYLLHTSNKLAWKNPFGHSDRHLAIQVDASPTTIRKAKKRLMAAGLIMVTAPEKPSNSLSGQTQYTLLTVSKNDTVEKLTVSNNDTVCNTVSDTVYNTVGDANNKLNKTKLNLSISEEIRTEFSDFENDVKVNYPNVAKLEKQITLSQYNSLRTELQLTPVQITNVLQRMDNYKPLLKNYVSVNQTLRQWHNKEVKNSPINNTTDVPKNYGR